MKPFRRSAALILAILLLVSLAACSKTGSKPGADEGPAAWKGLPVLYLDGKAYPVTVEDGVKGLEQVHGGVVSLWNTEGQYDAFSDTYKTVYQYGLFRSDGTQELDYSGERKIWLASERSTGFNFPSPDGMRALCIETVGLPFPDGLPEDEALLRSTLENNGFFEYLPGEFLCCFTEAGVIDISTAEFRDLMRQTVRESRDFQAHADDEDWIEDYVSRESGLVSLWAARRLQRQALEDGSTRIVCDLFVKYDSNAGTYQIQLGLYAPSERISDWYARWDPAHGDRIRPLHD